MHLPGGEALAAALGITVTLVALPFALKNAMRESRLLADLGQWMPLGAITILAVYCLSIIHYSWPFYGAAQLAGVAVTAAAHLWRQNLVLSLVTGTTTCLVLTNLVLAWTARPIRLQHRLRPHPGAPAGSCGSELWGSISEPQGPV